ncbi:hypothetical protein TYRP_005752 [Tyrophagus putrescentiae]|nr:hypothetical protein TYRP_005752 [Tyrophagus putrescentiae]
MEPSSHYDHPHQILFSLIVVVLLVFSSPAAFVHCDPVELIPKMVRWPTHIDHYLCKQLHNGLGVRSHAVTNLNGDLCRTYCRIIDRMNGKITYTENVTPNFVRCGPYQARCVDGACVGLNFPTPGSAPPPPPAEEAIPELTAESSASNNSGNETAIESAEVSQGTQSGEAISTDDNSSVGSFASTSTTTSLPTLFSKKGGSDQQRQQHYQTLNDRNERRVTRQATQILIPKMVRWPTHIDHYLCKKLHNGLGVRSHAVTNLNGDLCRTYCRIIDRMNGKITYTENVTPNFVRCGPYQARCVDGACVGLNFPTPGSAPPPPPAEEAIPELTAESSASNNSGNETAIESAEVSAGGQSGEAISTDDNSSVGSFASTSTTTSLPTLFSEKGGSDQQRQQHYQTLNDRNERRVTRQATQIVKT